MNDDLSNLLLLTQRPSEPSFFPKNNGKVKLELPSRFIPDEYKVRGVSIDTRFTPDDVTPVQINDTELPDLSFANAIDRNAAFSSFIPKHAEIAGELTAIFMKASDAKTLMSIATYARDRVNIYLFQYAYAVALNHRTDTQSCK